VVVEFVEDSEGRKVTREKKWRLRHLSDDQEVDFDSLKEGDQVSSYWSPNRAYYVATVISVDLASGKYRLLCYVRQHDCVKWCNYQAMQ
jgi:hypothetical protein